MATKAQVLKGRRAVDAYRLAHQELYWGNPHKGISKEHTPLLEVMLKELGKQGFDSLQEFFSASEGLNIQELGDAEKGWQ